MIKLEINYYRKDNLSRDIERESTTYIYCKHKLKVLKKLM